MTPVPCPFCRTIPQLVPEYPSIEGDAWGAVQCVNPDCPTYDPIREIGVSISDGEDIADSRGSQAYIEAAVRRWNNALERKGTDK